MSPKPATTFSTRDLAVAATLLASDCVLAKIEFDERQRGVFCFDNEKKCSAILADHYAGQVFVSSKKLFDSHLSLKNRLRDASLR